MAKNDQHKNGRAEIGDKETVHKMDSQEKERLAIGYRKRMDITHYERMEKYKGMQLFWATSRNGDVEFWLEAGAKPVPKVGRAAEIYKGINDRVKDEYEIAHAVSVIEGVPEDNYLLFLPKDEYARLKIIPKENRNREIRKAMGIGKADGDSITLPQVKGLKTYAPSVGDGKFGVDTAQVGELTHDVWLL